VEVHRFRAPADLVRETVVLGDEDTKTDGSQRDIQMSQLVFEALKRQHAATGKVSASCSAIGSASRWITRT
jgi:integrase